MQDLYSTDSYPPQRPAWRTKLYGIVLALALLGLMGCLAAMGYLCCTM